MSETRRSRERERERDVSATLTHLATDPCGHATIPNTSVLTGLTRTQPLIITIRPSPLHPLQKRLKVNPED
jgi:hypothetical protein